ncbi:MAG: response regulator [Leptospiraceae bacterium]|nr:response regulator [Leptospiraceae bacterium]MCP5512554.1 response regulator [Leptospiraceae bacterium]
MMNELIEVVNVLIVDDSEDNRDILEALIQAMGHNTIPAENGLEALDVLKLKDIHLILLDINMPIMDGYETIVQIRKIEKHKQTPILMVSANDEVESIVRCLHLGADDFISKPFDPDILSARVNNSLLRLSYSLEEKKLRDQITKERDQSEFLLMNILPEEIANELRKNGMALPQLYESASVLFTDFVSFTSIAEKLNPRDLVDELNSYFIEFDQITQKYGLEKIKTIGDSYMCVGGLPKRNDTHPSDTVLAGLEMQEYMNRRRIQSLEEGKVPWDLRIGIHTGSVVAGVIGKKKFAYDIWGDTVNVASRMESTGQEGKVNISEDTYHLIQNDFECEYRGMIQPKNKPKMKMYFVLQKKLKGSVNE